MKKKRVKKSNEIFSFLFVGNFQYFPNQDAINWLVSDILPTIRLKAKQAFKITLIGSGKLPNITKLNKIPELKIIQDAEDLRPYYNNADVVLVPIRAGGGTRIKIIEAFSFNIPVVSTNIGIEGIEAIHRKNVLIADDANHFADCCLEFMNNPCLRISIAAKAAKLFNDRYCADHIKVKPA